MGLLAEHLLSCGLEVCETREPGGTETGERLRELILENAHFVCNETYYRTLHAIRQQALDSEKKEIPAIFVHIPSFEYVSMEDQSEILIELCAQIVQRI